MGASVSVSIYNSLRLFLTDTRRCQQFQTSALLEVAGEGKRITLHILEGKPSLVLQSDSLGHLLNQNLNSREAETRQLGLLDL